MVFQMQIDPDDDNDGTPDSEDAFPEDPERTVDTDGDEIGDNKMTWMMIMMGTVIVMRAFKDRILKIPMQYPTRLR